MANATTNLFVIGVMAVLPVSGDPSRGPAEKAAPDLVVFVEGSNLVTTSVLRQAEATGSRMFAGIGVNVLWTERRPVGSGEPAVGACTPQRPMEIGVRIALQKTSGASHEAFASANPYASNDMRITLFYGELHEALRPQSHLEATVMAHVLVHELTHVLQRVARHSKTGVMQAHWTPRDYTAMQRSPLEFTEEDIDLIHLGLRGLPVRCVP